MTNKIHVTNSQTRFQAFLANERYDNVLDTLFSLVYPKIKPKYLTQGEKLTMLEEKHLHVREIIE